MTILITFLLCFPLTIALFLSVGFFILTPEERTIIAYTIPPYLSKPLIHIIEIFKYIGKFNTMFKIHIKWLWGEKIEISDLPPKERLLVETALSPYSSNTTRTNPTGYIAKTKTVEQEFELGI